MKRLSHSKTMNVRSLAKELLGKEIQELALEDLRTFFLKERKESDVLEFKSYSTEKGQKDPNEHLRAVHKTICAFLNSQGGVLVWGAPIGQKREGEKEKVFVGELTKVEVDLEDDQIADGILQSVSPMPSGFTFKKLGDGTSRIYVFEVKSSPYSPHQIKGAYFARFTAQTHPAPHYLVEALMRRVTFPNIAAYVQLNAVSKEPGKVVVSFIISCVNHSRLQNERNITVTAYTSHGSFPRNNFTPKNIDISSDGKRQLFRTHVTCSTMASIIIYRSM